MKIKIMPKRFYSMSGIGINWEICEHGYVFGLSKREFRIYLFIIPFLPIWIVFKLKDKD